MEMDKNRRAVLFDLETGGLDSTCHPVTQIAAVAVDAGWNILEEQNWLVSFRPEECEPEALALNSFDPARWEHEAIAAERVMEEFSWMLKRHASIDRISKRGNPYRTTILGGYNTETFDKPFLSTWAQRAAGDPWLGIEWSIACDVHQLVKWAAFLASSPPESLSLEGVCAWLGIELTGAHDALADVKATVEVARRLARCFDPDLEVGGAA